jgi:hypothetical protein
VVTLTAGKLSKPSAEMVAAEQGLMIDLQVRPAPEKPNSYLGGGQDNPVKSTHKREKGTRKDVSSV